MIEKAKRLVEYTNEAVIPLDYTTCLARTYNTVVPPSGKVFSSGVDSNALQRPKTLLRRGPEHRGWWQSPSPRDPTMPGWWASCGEYFSIASNRASPPRGDRMASITTMDTLFSYAPGRAEPGRIHLLAAQPTVPNLKTG